MIKKRLLPSVIALLLLSMLMFTLIGCDVGTDAETDPSPTPTVDPNKSQVTGQVRNLDGDPEPGAIVEYHENGAIQKGQSRQTASATANSNGYYHMSVPPGSGSMTVYNRNGVLLYQNVPVEFLAGYANRVDFPEGQKLMVKFCQISATIDGTDYNNSSWGAAEINIPADNNVKYFNLAVDNQWVLQNIPMTAADDTDIVHATFNLNVSPGTRRTTMYYAVNLTEEPMSEMPGFNSNAFVDPLYNNFNSGIQNINAEFNQPQGPIAGGGSTETASHPSDFPNQECGENECAPAAASNSLKYLDQNSEQDLSGFSDIESMKEALSWTSSGVDPDWYNDKDQYMQNNGHPISTTHTTDFEVAIQAVKDGKDVELTGGWHAAAVVGITKTSNGKYQVEVVHDKKQGEEGGLTKETITYDPSTGKFSGSPGFFDGSQFRHFTIEMVQ